MVGTALMFSFITIVQMDKGHNPNLTVSFPKAIY